MYVLHEKTTNLDRIWATKASAFSKIGVLGGISASLKTVHDEKVLTSPSDFVEAVRIVHTKTNEGQTDLFHTLSKTEDFC